MPHIPLTHIDPNPWQPRQGESKEHIEALAADIYASAATYIESSGLMQLPVGRLVDTDGNIHPPESLRANELDAIKTSALRVQLAFGHSRLAAFRLLARKHPRSAYSRMPVRLAVLSDQDMNKSAWSETKNVAT